MTDDSKNVMKAFEAHLTAMNEYLDSVGLSAAQIATVWLHLKRAFDAQATGSKMIEMDLAAARAEIKEEYEKSRRRMTKATPDAPPSSPIPPAEDKP